LRNILRQEREGNFQKSDQIIEEVTDEILDEVINILKRKSEFPDKGTIEFLAECSILAERARENSHSQSNRDLL
jgi:hypothetical protein